MKNPVLLSVLALAAGIPAVGVQHANAREHDDAWLQPGGAIRFNYGWLDHGQVNGPELELLRVDLKGGTGPVSFSLQYRWYDGFDAVHHAWIGLDDGQGGQVRAGIVQQPFGLLPTVSHGFWFGSGYYLGLEDDYDLGVVWERGDDSRQWQLAWLAGDEYGSGSRLDRYSFDVATTPDHPYRERGRLHARYQRTHAFGDAMATWGASAFTGRVQDVQSRRHYGHHALALHGQWSRGPWSLQAQWARYRYAVPGDRIALSAFLAPFEIAAEADVPSVNVAYALPRTGWLDAITCYNDLSGTRPVAGNGLRHSVQNVTGCSFGKGPMLAYVDWIAGRNMWFAGGPGIGIDDGDGGRWHSRLNVNVGFYF